MRLGGPVFGDVKDPARWVAAHREAGFTAAYVPGDTWEQARPYVEAARAAGIVLAEVGAWSNPISIDDAERRKAIDLCCRRLDIAEQAGACCCVNIAGSRGAQWDGPHRDNLTTDTFDLIVRSVRQIIDAVHPTRTFYTLETMPWAFPDSPDSYLALIRAIDRKAFAVHLDAVNMVNSPSRFYGNAALVAECFAKLGPFIKSCHAKDITLAGRLTVHLDEVRLGLGGMDYRAFLTEASRLPPDLPIMLEHLPSQQDYTAAAQHLNHVAQEIGLPFL